MKDYRVGWDGVAQGVRGGAKGGKGGLIGAGKRTYLN